VGEGVDGREVRTGRRQWRTAGLGGGCACARGAVGAGFYRRWRSVRGSWGQPHRRCTRGVGSKARRRAAERRPNGVWRLARRRVGNGHLAPSKRTRMSPTVALPVRRMDCWVRRARRAYSGLAWRARGVARERALASRGENSSLIHCSKLFFSDFQTIVHLTLYSKVEDHTSLYDFHKGW
jgi:hypothetical protein